MAIHLTKPNAPGVLREIIAAEKPAIDRFYAGIESPCDLRELAEVP